MTCMEIRDEKNGYLTRSMPTGRYQSTEYVVCTSQIAAVCVHVAVAVAVAVAQRQPAGENKVTRKQGDKAIV